MSLTHDSDPSANFHQHQNVPQQPNGEAISDVQFLSSDDAEGYVTENKKSFRRMLMIGAPLVAGAVAIGSLSLLKKGGDSPATNASPEITPSSEASPIAEVPTGPDKNTALGLVSVTDTDILVDRPGGRQMLIPHLRTSSVNEFMDSFLTQFACYTTTGDEKCVEEVTDRPNVRNAYTAIRDQLDIPEVQASFNLKNAQVEIFGHPVFLSGKVADSAHDTTYVELSPDSELFLDVSVASDETKNTWQAHVSSVTPRYKITKLRVEYYLDKVGKPNVTGFDIDTNQNA